LVRRYLEIQSLGDYTQAIYRKVSHSDKADPDALVTYWQAIEK
jgi:hypothetical protein